ncbi:hypothetical protein [Streptococcus halichoeri]|uniref:hypothetical protein n=1 Tax=Streptococcus halichoeri TaxID=254785 RepID=UPI00135B1648|nr:hypothetical protein [Streptococcus halichoeri]
MIRSKVAIPFCISTVFILLLGILLNVNTFTVIKLILCAISFEYVCYQLSKPKGKAKLSLEQTISNFLRFLNLTKYFQVLYYSIIILEIFLRTSPLLMLFYVHIIVVFYSVGFIISMNNVELKKKGDNYGKCNK